MCLKAAYLANLSNSIYMVGSERRAEGIHLFFFFFLPRVYMAMMRAL